MLIAHTPPHRLQSFAVQLGEVDIEDRRDHVEVFSQRQKAQEREKRQLMDQVGPERGDPQAIAAELKRAHS